MIGIPLGWLYINASEWFIHKHVLHGLGRSKKSFWAFHWHDHHRESRRRGMADVQYEGKLFRKWDAQTKEATALLAGALVHLPLLPVAPFFTGTVWYRMWRYYHVHKRAHLDPEWAREHLPWHYDHHMGRNQNANWCVTHPFFDNLLGTRREFLGVQPPAPAEAGTVPVEARERGASASPGLC